jgi:2-keto-3-deoxy-6-phosphogluconate aldolase
MVHDRAGIPYRIIAGRRRRQAGDPQLHRAVLYEFPGADPATDRFTHKTTKGSVTIVLIGDPSTIPALATELADAGIELVELCGGVPLAVRSRVKAAISSETRVASVTFGIESIVKAAEFNRAFMDGTPPAEACIVLAPGANPTTDRFVRSAGPQNATFIMADERAAPDVARQLADQGVGLIELYGGFSDETASDVIDAVAGRSAVGVSGFGH